jgi:hypothetical protein
MNNTPEALEPPFPINKRFNYPELTAITYPTGGRVYQTPTGNSVPSVTTILSNTLPKEALVAWRQKVGDEEADRITAEACRIGTTMHDRLEGYVSNYIQGRPNIPPEDEEDLLAYKMADNLRRFALVDLDEIWGIEEALFCEDLYAGRTDLIGVYKGKSAIIDYKSTKKPKKSEWVEGYKMQLAAYNLCHLSMFNERMDTGVIMMAVRPPYSVPVQMFVLQKDEMLYWEGRWVEAVQKFYERIEREQKTKGDIDKPEETDTSDT